MRAIDAELASGGGIAIADTMPCRRIVLSSKHGIFCLVDVEDYDWAMQWPWNWGWHNRTPWKFYAKRNTGRARSTLYLHRELMMHLHPSDDDFHARHVVDHINGNSLDNRRGNLRWVTQLENRRNAKRRDMIPSLEAIVAELAPATPADRCPF